MLMKKDRVKTYVKGLDELMGGGLPLSSSILVVGGPGAGKTTLCSQFVHNGAMNGEKGAIILIGQTKEKFRRDILAFGLDFAALEKKGIVRIYELPVYDKKFDASFSNLVLELDEFRPRRIVMDSFSIFFSSVDTGEKHKEMIRTLGHLTKDAVALLTLEKHSKKADYLDEFFASDGVIDLGLSGSADADRKLRIIKMRQTSHSMEAASYKLGDDGFRILHRPPLNHPGTVSFKKAATGITSLDEVIGGGFFRGTTILVAGSSGTGKTIMGLQFLIEGAKENEKGLFISFEESDKEIMRNISSIGWKLNGIIDSGRFEFYCAYPENMVADEIISILEQKLIEGHHNRVVIDSISRLSRCMEERAYLDFLKRISAVCRENMSTLMVLGESTGGDSINAVSEMNISSLVEGIVLLRHIEVLGEMRRSMIIVKLRGAQHDKRIKEFVIGDGGITLKGDIRDMEALIPAIEELG